MSENSSTVATDSESLPPKSSGWCAQSPKTVCDHFSVDPQIGLTANEVAERRNKYGRNKLAEPPRRPKWLLFLDPFRAGIVYILAGAGILAGLVGDIKDLIVIFVVLFINAVLGFLQESKASNALDALEKMLVTRVRVRRSGDTVEIAIDELVPGDIVLLEAGDRVPADGRMLFGANVSVDESSLTGESVPVEKDAQVEISVDSPLGDRRNMVYMNTTVVRGRAEVIVTETGMSTEIGRVAELITSAKVTKTPLERQLDGLSRRLAIIAGVAATVVFIAQLIIERNFADAILGAVALAVAAIPEGLPAVVTVTLAIGISQMAKQNAIVKRLHSVETLGSTSVICSDKTGTLTLNQMTTQKVIRGGVVLSVDGEGYEPTGKIRNGDSVVENELVAGAFLPAVLCADAVLTNEGGFAGIIGDPTEAALVVLAAKVGLDASTERTRRPRLGEVPFDSEHKFMATFHRLDPADPQGDVLLCVKGAPDVVLSRCSSFAEQNGHVTSLDDNSMAARLAENDSLAANGMRVLAVATRRIAAADCLDANGNVADPDAWISQLNLEFLAGIVDPARIEVRDAISLCRKAGIGVKMITGDHAVAAGAIARELGIEGEVVTGEQLDAMSEEELIARVEAIGVCARVSPEHKVRVVEALRARGRIVAMTGDGVNDAAALRRADIGVAMGITGTEVTKEAGDMVLTDDNFATIVSAVERGRVVYDNILKFVRFQVATAFGAISTIFGASVLGQHVPFLPLQVLWVNLIADGPTAVSLGVDGPDPDVMSRKPVSPDEAILNKRRFSIVVFQGVVTAIGVLTLYLIAISHYSPNLPSGEAPQVAMTMAFTAFVVVQLVNVYNARSETRSIFSRYTLTNWKLGLSVIIVFLLQIVITEVTILMDLFETTRLSLYQWLWCLVPAVFLLVAVEIWKLIARTRSRSHV